MSKHAHPLLDAPGSRPYALLRRIEKAMTTPPKTPQIRSAQGEHVLLPWEKAQEPHTLQCAREYVRLLKEAQSDERRRELAKEYGSWLSLAVSLDAFAAMEKKGGGAAS
jgi:hypothetical protein